MSAVSIDPLPKHFGAYIQPVAEVLTSIMNDILRGEGWPSIWKKEEVTVIPKGSAADTMDECRNITCTSMFSKLAESFMLDRLREEIPLDENQYGGVRGIGTDHMIADLVTDVMQCLEDPRAALGLRTLHREYPPRRPHQWGATWTCGTRASRCAT